MGGDSHPPRRPRSRSGRRARLATAGTSNNAAGRRGLRHGTHRRARGCPGLVWAAADRPRSSEEGQGSVQPCRLADDPGAQRESPGPGLGVRYRRPRARPPVHRHRPLRWPNAVSAGWLEVDGEDTFSGTVDRRTVHRSQQPAASRPIRHQVSCWPRVPRGRPRRHPSHAPTRTTPSPAAADPGTPIRERELRTRARGPH